MRTNTRFSITIFYALLISACSNNDNYPKEYIGFEKQFISHTYDTKNEEETLTLKIIAAEKQDTDRKLTISSSTSNNSFHIQNAHPVILKGKKSVKIDIILYPKQIKSVQRIIRLICTPDGKDAKISEISIRLQKK